MKIGDISKLCRMSIDTVRFYERQGLIPKPARRASGYREYDQDDVLRLRFIRRSKELGFTLRDIGELLSLSAYQGSDMAHVKQKAEQRLEEVEGKIKELQRMRRGLKTLIEACPGHGTLRSCPIIEALSGAE
jgi:MerR family copper efflux transcriptional regulator